MSLTLSQRLSFKRFTKGEPAEEVTIALNHRRIFILPSKGGLAMALVILLMLIASINYNNSMGFVFTFLLAAAAQASTFYSYKNLSGLRISIAKSPPCFVDSRGEIGLLIKEPNERERWAVVASHLNSTNAFNLQNGQSLQITLTIQPTQRGWYYTKTITLASQFPFGFFRAWSPLRFKQALLVYPKALDTGLMLPLKHSEESDGIITSQQAGTDDFYGLQPYQKGHSYRHINWKALAAEKGFYTNQFSAEQSATINLDWQSCASLPVESKLSQLCYWVNYCEAHGFIYGLQIPTADISPSSGHSHQHACLKALALYE